MYKKYLALVPLLCCAQLRAVEYTSGERGVIDALSAAKNADAFFAGKKKVEGRPFAVNAPHDVKLAVTQAFDAIGSTALDDDDFKKNEVVMEWAKAKDENWQTNNGAKQAVRRIMDIYSRSQGKAPLFGAILKILPLPQYKELRDLAIKIDGFFAGKEFATGASVALKADIRDAVDRFVELCKPYSGLGSEGLRKIANTFFVGWERATKGTDWLDADVKSWISWQREHRKNAERVAVGVKHMVELYRKKGVHALSDELEQIFKIVREVLAHAAEIAALDEKTEGKIDVDELAGLKEAAKEVDRTLGKVSKNAGQNPKEAADEKVADFLRVCEASSKPAVRALIKHPIVASWNDVKMLSGWYDLDGQDKKKFDKWKETHKAASERFAKDAKFMDAYAKSPFALLNAVGAIARTASSGAGQAGLEEKRIQKLIEQLVKKLDAWKPPAQPALPKLAGGRFGSEEEEAVGGEKIVKRLASSLKQLLAEKSSTESEEFEY